MERIMKHMHRPWIPVVLPSSIVLVAGLWGSGPAGAQPAGVAPPRAAPFDTVPAGIVRVPATVVAAAVNGAVSSSGGPAEAVVFSGQASISGKVIDDPHLGAPPVLEIVIDLSNVSGKGVQSGKTYQVSTQAVLHRPLLAFDSIELNFPFSAAGDASPARSALASFGIRFSDAGGVSTTPVTIR
jgi:hypothetical protein